MVYVGYKYLANPARLDPLRGGPAVPLTSPPTTPTVTSFTPTSGSPGTVVTINGSNLTGATSVRFGVGSTVPTTVLSSTQIRATVPANGAVTGQLTVTTPAGVATSPTSFTVTNVGVPTGYTLFRTLNFAVDEGWSEQSGIPGNATATRRPANVSYGQGPNGTSMMLTANRDTPGGTVYVGEANGYFLSIPPLHRMRAVFSFDTMSVGMWPALWLRPNGTGEGEIDYWEKFGSRIGFADEDRATLHSTPYDTAHFQVASNFPTTLASNVNHTLECEMTSTVFRTWVNGVPAPSITKTAFDAASGGRWNSMFTTHPWYPRLTIQAGGPYAGTVPTSLNLWRLWFHELHFYVPA